MFRLAFPIAALILAFSAFAAPAQEFLGAPGDTQIEKARTDFPALQFELIFSRKRFALGEAIPVVMRYTNGGSAPLALHLVNYDRAGRIMAFSFSALDNEDKAARDPYPFQGGIGGGLSTSKALRPGETFEQNATVNEWIAFDRPGIYRISAYSGIIGVPDKTQSVGMSYFSARPIPLRSAPVEIEITAPDEAARQHLFQIARAELQLTAKKQATLSPRISDYNREQQVGHAASDALRDLRWLVDERAIPLLIQGLELGDGAEFQAHRGLAAFPNGAPVRAALVARLQNGTPLVEGVWSFKNLLTRFAPTPEKPGSIHDLVRGYTLSPADEALFNRPLRASLVENLASHDPQNAARDAVLLFQNDKDAPADTAIWRAFWPGAALLSEEQQWTVALLLFSEKERAKTLPAAIPDLRNAARDARLSAELRSAAVVALAARGDFSLRPLLAQDVTAPTPHFTSAAYATLGDYKAREIALRLLHQLRLPHESAPAEWDEISARIRNIGRGATLDELVGAARWTITHSPDDQGPLLEAVALRDPEKALVLVRESLSKRPVRDFIDARLGVLVRLDTAAARRQVRALLHSPQEIVLRAVLEQIESSLNDLLPDSLFSEGTRRLQAPRTLAESLVPEIAPLSFAAPSLQVRQASKSLLMRILQLDMNSNDPRVAQNAAWHEALNDWWQKNAARLGRAGVVIDSTG